MDSKQDCRHARKLCGSSPPKRTPRRAASWSPSPPVPLFFLPDAPPGSDDEEEEDDAATASSSPSPPQLLPLLLYTYSSTAMRTMSFTDSSSLRRCFSSAEGNSPIRTRDRTSFAIRFRSRRRIAGTAVTVAALSGCGCGVSAAAESLASTTLASPPPPSSSSSLDELSPSSLSSSPLPPPPRALVATLTNWVAKKRAADTSYSPSCLDTALKAFVLGSLWAMACWACLIKCRASTKSAASNKACTDS
mmetsp:Transcript_46794/g.92605  ORF Transcript_46794/g.92605 Transcript_46794/m.92605 type:complete len:248 (+) Transcript_46794:186-929(+)